MKKILFVLLFGSVAFAQTGVVPFRTPRATFTDPNGFPLANGCIFTYQGGTSTPQATYTDSTGNTPNSNPVILDSSGSAVMWLAGANAYKFVAVSSGGVNCASGTQQWSVDNVPGNAVLNGVISGATITNGTITGAAITGGTESGTAITGSTLDSTPIGQSTPAVGKFTSLASAYQAVTFSATPTFDASSYGYFSMTLTGNVTSSTITGGQTGQQISFDICQDGTGGRTFAWPPNLSALPGSSLPTVSPVASSCTLVVAFYNGANWVAFYSNQFLLTGQTKAVTFSTTPVFDASSYTNFNITLTGNVISSSITNPQQGQLITLNVCQDATGGRAFVWPTNVYPPVPVVNPSQNTCTGTVMVFNSPYWYVLGTTGSATISQFTVIQSIGTQAVAGCALTSAKGGMLAGSFQSGVSGTCTVTITPTPSVQGLACWASDLTTPADTIAQTVSSPTGATLSGTTVTGDLITWGCVAY